MLVSDTIVEIITPFGTWKIMNLNVLVLITKMERRKILCKRILRLKIIGWNKNACLCELKEHKEIGRIKDTDNRKADECDNFSPMYGKNDRLSKEC